MRNVKDKGRSGRRYIMTGVMSIAAHGPLRAAHINTPEGVFKANQHYCETFRTPTPKSSLPPVHDRREKDSFSIHCYVLDHIAVGWNRWSSQE